MILPEIRWDAGRDSTLGDGEAAGVGMTCECIGFTGTGDSVVGFGEEEGTGGRRVERVLWLKL